MVDLSEIDLFNNWLFNTNGEDISNRNSSIIESSSQNTNPSTLENNDEKVDINKRKYEQSSELTQPKKSKQTPIYMRRNIRHLLTNDKLQTDTITALQAEQDRIKRLEQINENYQSLNTNYYVNQYKRTPNEQEYIILDDDDENHINNSSILSRTNLDTKVRTNHDVDDDDDDIQCIDEDTEIEDEQLTKKLQRLHIDDRINVPDENGNIIVNINHPSEDPDIFLPNHLCSTLKPHQIGGIRFMYDNIVESLQRFPTTSGLGCILAHSMGCGKTLQVISFIDVLFRYTTVRTILVVVPINTIQNWANEFNRWCPVDNQDIGYKRPYKLFILNDTAKKATQRAQIIQEWSQKGGTLIIGYEMFRLMVTKKLSQTNSSTKNTNINRLNNILDPISSPIVMEHEEEEKNLEIMETIRNSLIRPDIVICDEGHRIKNHQAGIALALKSIHTKRRIVLTGYPLQNNLVEYWCMVDFVRPNYLGSKKEFCNMFERPLQNGQCMDSTNEDRQVMRARGHVLHSLLEGFVQRRSHEVLQSELPTKTEYVILLKTSNIQQQLYTKFLEAICGLANSFERLNPLRAFAICCKIWNHPDVLYKFVQEYQHKLDLDFDFDIENNSNTINKTLITETKSLNRLSTDNLQLTNRNYSFEPQISMNPTEKKDFDYNFANSILNSYVRGDLSNGIKFQVALRIIDLSIQLNDKVLLFSQSLLSLDKFEEFLYQRQVPNTEQTWKKNFNYYRLDGGTNGLERERLINAFNDRNSDAKLFLISTRAGCLGINLTAANRVIVMDVSWNPCLDAQSIFRVYRYGQKKHCYIYRLIADFTMEKRIYDRQIAKQGMSDRVVDEMQSQSQFTKIQAENLIRYAAEVHSVKPIALTEFDKISTDQVLLSICKEYVESITKLPFTHESLLTDHKEDQLTSAEKRRAKIEYQNEKRMNNHSKRSRFNTNNSRYFNGYDPHLNQLLSESRFPPQTDRKFEQFQSPETSIRPVILQSPLEIQLNNAGRQLIPAGTKIDLLENPRGSFIRTPDGKLLIVRQPSPMTNNPKPIPPPPLPTSNLIDNLTFDSLPIYPSPTTDGTNDDINLLIDSIISNPSSALLDLDNSLPNNFFSDLFPNQSDVSTLLNNNNNNSENFPSKSLSLF